MSRRPWPLLILGYLHLLKPPLYFALLFFQSNQNLEEAWLKLGSTWQVVQFWSLFPLAGLAILSFRPWCYPVLVVVWFESFLSGMLSGSETTLSMSLPLLRVNFLLGFMVLIYFSFPRVRTVYFDSRVRWWEQKPRFLAQFNCKISCLGETIRVQVIDVAEGGMQLSTERSFKENEILDITVPVQEKALLIRGKVVYVGLQGGVYGIKFIDLTRNDLEELRLFLKSLKQAGLSQRSDKIKTESFFSWLHRVVTSGKGLLPEVPQAYLRAVPSGAEQQLNPDLIKELEEIRAQLNDHNQKLNLLLELKTKSKEEVSKTA